MTGSLENRGTDHKGPSHKRLSCEKTPGDLHFLTCSIAFLLAHSNPTRTSYSCMYMNSLTDSRHPDMYTQFHSEMDADVGTQTCNAALPSLAQAHSHSYTCAGTSYHGSELLLRPKLMTPSISQKFKRNLSKVPGASLALVNYKLNTLPCRKTPTIARCTWAWGGGAPVGHVTSLCSARGSFSLGTMRS